MKTMAGYLEKLWDVMAWAGHFHVVVIHFPIALIIGAAVPETWSLCQRKCVPAPAVRFCVFLGAAGAALAALLGWFEAPAAYAVPSGSMLFVHRWLGTVASAWAVGLLLLSELDQRRGRRTNAFRGALFVGALLLGFAGHFGGLISHGTDYFDWPRQAATARPVSLSRVLALYHEHCADCHGADGRGDEVRADMPTIPNFTDLNWQINRTDDNLRQQIRRGKPPLMPGFEMELQEQEAAGMTVLIRALAVAPDSPPAAKGEPEGKPGSPLTAAPDLPPVAITLAGSKKATAARSP
jgi:mono/diheme cytochrome c family protein